MAVWYAFGLAAIGCFLFCFARDYPRRAFQSGVTGAVLGIGIVLGVAIMGPRPEARDCGISIAIASDATIEVSSAYVGGHHDFGVCIN